jgi:hypothetical protein
MEGDDGRQAAGEARVAHAAVVIERAFENSPSSGSMRLHSSEKR